MGFEVADQVSFHCLLAHHLLGHLSFFTLLSGLHHRPLVQLLSNMVYDFTGVVLLYLILQLCADYLSCEEVNSSSVLVALANVVAVELAILLELSEHRVVPGVMGLGWVEWDLLTVLSALVGEEVPLNFLTSVLSAFAASFEGLVEWITCHCAYNTHVCNFPWLVAVQDLLYESVVSTLSAQLSWRIQRCFRVFVQAMGGLV